MQHFDSATAAALEINRVVADTLLKGCVTIQALLCSFHYHRYNQQKGPINSYPATDVAAIIWVRPLIRFIIS